MNELLILEICVDEGADDTYLWESQPESDELRTVLKKDGRTVSFLQMVFVNEKISDLVAVVLKL